MDHNWTTRLEHTGDIEMHQAWFVPLGWPGAGTTVSLGLPECELQVVYIDQARTPVAIINRPKSRQVSKWIRFACSQAIELKACLLLCCDTPEEVSTFAPKALAWLPGYKRMPLERIYRTEDRRDIAH